MELESLSDDVLLLILQNLAIADLESATLVSSRWRALMILPSFYASILHRNYGDGLAYAPYCREECLLLTRKAPLPDGPRERFRVISSAPSSVSLRSIGHGTLWSADFGPHGKEYVLVERHGYELKLLKLTGDPNVPRGQYSVQATIASDLSYAVGKITLAEAGFQNPHSAHCEILVRGESMSSYWFHSDPPDNMGLILPTYFKEEPQGLLERLQSIIAEMEKDELGNVDNEEVERRLGFL